MAEMATQSEIDQSSDQDNRSVMESFNCTQCLSEGKTVVAIKFCIECDENICFDCLQNHNKIRLLRGHKFENCAFKDNSNKGQALPIAETMCIVHPGKPTDMYCADDESICCAVCMALSHRSCQNVNYIHDVQSSQEIMQAKLGDRKALRENDLKILQEHKQKMLSNIENFESCLINRIKELAMKTKEEIVFQYKEPYNDIENDINEATKIMIETETNTNKMRNLTDEPSKEQVLNHMKAFTKNKDEGLKLLKEIDSQQNNQSSPPYFKKEENLEDFMNDLNALGEVVAENKGFEHSGSFHGQYNVKTEKDQIKCTIYGSCQLENGDIILADFQNYNLKRLDTLYSMKDCLKLVGGPWGVCQINPENVAVTLKTTKKVQIVSVEDENNMVLGQSFNVGFCCRGIVYNNKKLFVACGGGQNEGTGHIRVLNMSGNLVKTIKTDCEGQQLISFPKNMLLNKTANKLYIANGKQGLTSVCISSLKTVQISHKEIDLCGVCMKNDGTIFVCGWGLNNIFLLKKDGDGYQKLINEQESVKIENPLAVLYDKINSRLVLTTTNRNEIKVFDLKRKLKSSK